MWVFKTNEGKNGNTIATAKTEEELRKKVTEYLSDHSRGLFDSIDYTVEMLFLNGYYITDYSLAHGGVEYTVGEE